MHLSVVREFRYDLYRILKEAFFNQIGGIHIFHIFHTFSALPLDFIDLNIIFREFY